jgi:hypothetical protein
VKVLVQWTRRDPTDWIEVDSSEWPSLPKRNEPRPGQTGGTNNQDGWVFDVNVQGVHFGGNDHVAVEDGPDGAVIVYAWNDDPEDFPPGMRFGQRWTFLPLAPDPRFGGQLNTRQTREVWAEDTEAWKGSMPWAEFPKPAVVITRHGVWVDDGKLDEHKRAQSPRGWRDWA